MHANLQRPRVLQPNLLTKPASLGHVHGLRGTSTLASLASAAAKVGAAGILSPPLLPQVSAALHQARGFYTDGTDAPPGCGAQTCVCT